MNLKLRERAARCRRLAREIADQQANEILNQIADECDTMLATLETSRALAAITADLSLPAPAQTTASESAQLHGHGVDLETARVIHPAAIDRRRPGRIHDVSPALIPLLRKAGAIAGDLFPINSLQLVTLWAASAYPAKVWRSMSATERSAAIGHETLEMNERLALVD